MPKKGNLYIPLLGGLGNQLFQMAAGIENAKSRNLMIIANLGHQRRNEEGLPEICSFNLPSNLKISSELKSHLYCTTIFNQMLNPKFKQLFYYRIVNFIGLITLSFHLRQTVRIHLTRDIGYEAWPEIPSNEIGIGYFQTYKWLDNPNTLALMRTISPKVVSPKFEEMREAITSCNSAVIHLRLGDYVSEPGIGMLGSDYYLRAINALRQKYDAYWIFSDDIVEAKKMLSELPGERVLYVSPNELNTAETWELMRFGAGYVVSNSTYSWWAAKLSYNFDAEVVVPTPWFAAMKSPTEIIPPEWKAVDRIL